MLLLMKVLLLKWIDLEEEKEEEVWLELTHNTRSTMRKEEHESRAERSLGASGRRFGRGSS